ncbi:MAG: helix-turn-helix domain-containing protein [Bacteroidota bacterium]
MRKIYPQDELVSKYVQYYWQLGLDEVRDAKLSCIHDFPCLTPELILDFEGSATFFYKGQLHQFNPRTLFSYMDAGISVDLSGVTNFTVIRFRSIGPAAILPFLRCAARDLVQTQFVDANHVFSEPISKRIIHTVRAGSVSQKRDVLDSWLRRCFAVNRIGLLDDLSTEIQPHHDVSEIAKMSNLSLSSLERYFKRESGLTPKKFLLHNRFRLVLQDIASPDATDWHDLIVKYNYYDQTHLIKEVKRFSGLTPTELLRVNNLSTLRIIN